MVCVLEQGICVSLWLALYSSEYPVAFCKRDEYEWRTMEQALGGPGAGYKRTQNEGQSKSISNTKARFSLSLDPTATCEKVC